MPYLGVRGALVLVIAVLLGPVLALVSRRRWRVAAAKREEVMRLAMLAAAEAARAEVEANLSYASDEAIGGGGGGGIARPPQCAVCYSPTSTRCSRCKAVRYCSGKCQIIHWRQGHKEGCRPPEVDSYNSTHERISNLKGVQPERSNLFSNNLEIGGNPYVTPCKTILRSASSESSCSLEDFSEDDNLENRSLVDTPRTESSSDATAVSSSSCCSTFSCPVEKSDGASASKDSALLHNLTSDIACYSPKTCVTREVEPTKFQLPEFGTASLPVSSVSCVSNLNQKASTFKTDDVDCVSIGPSRLHATSTVTSTCNKLSGNAGECQDAKHSSNEASSLERTVQLKTRDAVALDSDRSVCVASGRCNDARLLKSKGFISPSSVSDDHISSCEGDHSVASCASSKIGTAPTYLMRLSGCTDLGQNGGNDLKTSVRGVVQKIKSSAYSRHQSSRLGSYPVNYNSKMLFPYDLFIKLYNCDKVELRPCGLTNCGNSCYANAVLQCLAFSRPLTAYLLEGLHTNTCPKQSWCFTCEFESLLMKAKHGRFPLSPIEIISHIRDIGSNLGHGREEDAHEFLRYAIDAMQSVCLKEAGKDAVGHTTEETTLVQLTFGGYLRSKIKCMRCNSKSVRQERMMDLTVEIHGDIGTLQEALVRFTATEILDGDNKYKCNRCKSYERAKKKLAISEAPNVLTITLKRFQFGKFGKINKTVRFPEYLNLAPYMRGTDDKSPVYRLYAVVVHQDIMNAAFSGHYVCYVKDTQGKWYKVDDSVVKPVELERVLKQGAYMLFYARCSPRPPSMLRKTAAHDHENTKSRCEDIVHRRREYPHRTNNNPTNFGPLDLFTERPHLPRTDSSSDCSSHFSSSSSSDVGSWSTDSTRDSTSAEEYSEYIFGESGNMNWNSPQRLSDDSDGFVCSPLSSRKSFESASNFSFQGKRSPSFLYS